MDAQEVIIGTIPNPNDDSTPSSIDAVRQAWLEATRAADVEKLAALVTDGDAVNYVFEALAVLKVVFVDLQ